MCPSNACDFTMLESGEIPYQLLTVEDDLLSRLKKIEPLVLKIIGSDEILFSFKNRRYEGYVLHATPTGKKLLAVLRNGQASFHYYFPLHDINPYVALLFECVDRFDSPMFFLYASSTFPHEVKQTVIIMNKLVEDMRREASSADFKRVIRRFVKAEKKREKSLNIYIDTLFNRYSRLVVIRLDLSYSVGSFKVKDIQQNLLEVKADWTKMQRDLHKGLPVKDMLGFACKLEYGHAKDFHFHLLVFYNGSTYRKDVALARLIGEHWRQEVTEGKGRYFNCNNKKRNYKFLGVGVVSHFDSFLISNLKSVVAAYLVKIDYWVRFSPGLGRSFYRGNMPKLDCAKRGRPRGIG
jgi:hypothetical protein